MAENTNINNGAGTPPMPPKKEEQNNKSNKKLLAVVIPIAGVILVAAIAVVLIFAKGNNNKNGAVVVTDENGVAITNVDGVPITVVPETEVVAVTDANGEAVTDKSGEVLTTVVYKEVTVTVPVTDKDGKAVTDANGNVVTENKTIVPGKSGEDGSTEKQNTSAVAITDGKGNTGVDASGNVLTTIVEITEAPTSVIDPAKTEWKYTKGGTAADYISDIKLTKDGCYLTANVTNSKDGDFAEFNELGYIAPYTVLTKTDNEGNILWQKAAGTQKGIFVITAIAVADDGSFYVTGYGKNVEGAKGYGYYDGFVAKYTANGEKTWVKKFGTSTVDIFNDVVITSDGGAVAVGSVGNNDKDASGTGGAKLNSRAVIVKFSTDGEIVWKNFVGGNQDYFSGVTETADGSLFAVGSFYSGELFTAKGKADGGVAKFKSNGTYVDILPIAGTGIDVFNAIITTSDGNVAVVGRSDSSDTENSFFKDDLIARGGEDAYLIKIDTNLKVTRATAFRGQNDERFEDLIEDENGNIIAVGFTDSSTRDLKGVTTRGGTDIVIACFDKTCDVLWARSFGGTLDDSANAICPGADGGYVIGGKTLSKDVDLSGIAPYVTSYPVAVVVKFPE